MDLQMTNRRIGAPHTVFDDFDERPVDCDILLPDFLPDIAAILKCTMKPVVQSHQISGDRVLADGTVTLRVLYLDEERKCVRCFENSQPFTSAFTVKDLKNGDSVNLSAKTNYVNCRATSPRRVDIHGAFSVKLVVMGQTETEIVEHADGENLYTKSCTTACTVPCGSADKTFTVNEVLELDGADSAEMILRSEAHIAITDCKQMPGKAVIKGDLLIKTVYTTDTVTGTVCTAKHTIPFSQLVDMDGMEESMLCECGASVLSCDIRLSQNPSGDTKLLSVSVKAALSICCFREETCNMLTDAFHTTYPLKVGTCHLHPTCIEDISRETVTVQQSLTLPDTKLTDVLDVWTEPVSVTCADGEGGAMLTGQLLVQLLARDENSMVTYFERPLDISVPQNVPCGTVAVNADVLDTEYTLNGDRLDLRIKLLICRRVSKTEHYTAITNLQADETAPYPCAEGMERCQVKVCFGEAGDSIWNIAKAAHASPVALKAENELKDDILSNRTLLLIPLV